VTTHVQVSPGVPVAGPTLTVVGGVPVVWIDQTTSDVGMTTALARFRLTNTSVDELNRPCPFAGLITVEGTGLAEGQIYRLLARNVTAGGPATPVTTQFLGSDHWGNPVTVNPGPDGWTPATGWGSDIILGIFLGSYGDDLWEISMETTAGPTGQTVKVLLDNTLKTADSAPGDPTNTADLEIDGGDCKVFNQGTLMTGTVIARDLHIGSWDLGTLPPQPPGTPAGVGVPTPSGGHADTPVAGLTWQLDTTQMRVCSYVMELVVVDRTIVNSGPSRRSVAIYRGFGIDA